MLPACEALTVTLPAPVTVSALFVIVAGPGLRFSSGNSFRPVLQAPRLVNRVGGPSEPFDVLAAFLQFDGGKVFNRAVVGVAQRSESNPRMKVADQKRFLKRSEQNPRAVLRSLYSRVVKLVPVR